MKFINMFLCLILFLYGEVQSQNSLSGREIQKKSIEATQVLGAEAIATMTIIDGKGRKRVRKLAQLSKLYDSGETEKKLIRFLEPADVKGTGFLTYDYQNEDDDKWLYLPALRKTRRIVSSENAKSFMGSEFSYADLTPPTIDDFTYKILGEETKNNVVCWKLEMIPKDEDIADENGFSRKIMFIGKDDYVVREAIFYDLDTELLKKFTVHEIREIDTKNHKYRLIHMKMENIQNGRKSIYKIGKIQFSPKIKDQYFTTRYLERK